MVIINKTYVMKYILFLAMLFTNINLFAQEIDEEMPITDTIYRYAEVMPEPPFNVNQYFIENLRYPPDARDKGIQGRVNVGFIVNTDGSLDSIMIVGDRIKYGASLEREAIRLIKGMPKWKPGRMNDKPVKVRYTQPFTWRIENDN
ncbi:hypothetical protein CAP35_05820 [Chitinophagaceae bacterium IBVUCB1]|nr:hypothetical protein CAP35_05820 [Chitinophagaceae bacterium IBVUCB1]